MAGNGGLERQILGRVGRILKDRPVLRKVAAPAYRTRQQFARPSAQSRVLVNSIPKAGTHLLTGILEIDGRLVASGWHFAPGQVGAPIEQLHRLRPGFFASGHVGRSAEAEEIICASGVRHVLLIRDPRDVVVSVAHYVTGNRRHPLHKAFLERSTLDERIGLAIQGFHDEHGVEQLESITDRFNRFLAWREVEDCFVVRFEDLVGPKGGGDGATQQATLSSLFTHIELPWREEDGARVGGALWGGPSVTFRDGRSGAWREYDFPTLHRWAESEECRRLLDRAGYGP